MRVVLSILKAAQLQLRFFLAILLGYLLQVCVMPYLRVGPVTPSLLFAVIAVLTVGYGKLRALWVGAIYGILTETMQATLPLLNLVLYPLSALFCSVFFADKTDKRLEYERSVDKRTGNLNPYLRTLLCAAVNVFIYEVVNVTYIYLGGAPLTAALFGKALLDVVASTLLTGIIVLPLRRFLGFKKRKKMSLSNVITLEESDHFPIAAVRQEGGCL